MTRNARKALGLVNRSPKNRKSGKPSPEVGNESVAEPPQAGEIVTMRDGTRYRRTEHGNLVRLPK